MLRSLSNLFNYLNSIIVDFNSSNIFRLVMDYWSLWCQGTGRDDDVVGTHHQGIGELADDIGEYFRRGLTLVEENIKLSIVQPLTSEMMILNRNVSGEMNEEDFLDYSWRHL